MRAEWNRTRLKYVADTNSAVLPEATDPNHEFMYVDIGNVTQGQMNVQSPPVTFAEAPSRARRLACPGDSVVSTVRTYLRAVASVPPSDEQLVFSTGFAVLSPREGVHPRFLSWYLQGDAFVSRVESHSTGVSYPAITASQLVGLDLALPPLDEQRAIADYLDRETARIDTLIEEQQRLIEMLRERRRVALIEATCRGLSPSATLRPSGVDWIGDIPSHWETIPIKWLTPVKRGASPRPIQDPVYFDDEGEWAWVRIADVSSAGSDGVLLATTQTLSDLGSSLSVKINPDELFVSIAGTVGKPCIAGIKCCIHDGFVYFPELGFDPWWLFRLFEAGECYGGLGKLGTQLNLNTDTIGGIRVPVPPSDEIRAILAYLDEQMTKIDKLIAETERFIELSRERRAALITAAVTGQIDVREVA